MYKNHRIAYRGVLVLADMYGLYVSLALLLWLISGEQFFFINIVVSLMPGIFYFVPVVLFVAIGLRSRETVAFLIVPILMFTFLYAPSFLPKPVSKADGVRLTLLTYNLRASNTNTDVLDDILLDASADIVSLQEVSVPIGDHVEARWLDEYPYHIRFTVDDFDPEYAGQLFLLNNDVAQYAGRLFLSRYPILDYEVVPSTVGTTLYIRAELSVNDRHITVYNVHLPPPLPASTIFSTEARNDGLVTLLDSVQTDDVIFMGDFNMTDQSTDYDLISNQYADVFDMTQNGLGTTWANGNNLSPLLFFVPSIIRIDYIFVSESVVPLSAQVIRDGVSDHYPLYAEVVLP